MGRPRSRSCAGEFATQGDSPAGVEVLPRGWYHFGAVTAKPADLPSDIVRAEQAARVAAMLERWAAEDTSDEPEWDVDQLEQIAFSPPPAGAEPTGS